MRIKLIEVDNIKSEPNSQRWIYESKVYKKWSCPPLALPIIASLTHPDIETSILDEKNEAIS